MKFLHDEAIKEKLAKTKKLGQVIVNDYDAIFFVGGHGPVLNLASDPTTAKLVSSVRIYI